MVRCTRAPATRESTSPSQGTETRVHAQAAGEGRRDAGDARSNVYGPHAVRRHVEPSHKSVHQRLPTDARIELWAGKESGMIECGCGHKLEWANRDQVGQLQWHIFTCTLPEETNVRRRWLQAVRCDIASTCDGRCGCADNRGAGPTRTTDISLLPSRMRDNVGALPQCDGKAEHGDLMT